MHAWSLSSNGNATPSDSAFNQACNLYILNLWLEKDSHSEQTSSPSLQSCDASQGWIGLRRIISNPSRCRFLVSTCVHTSEFSWTVRGVYAYRTCCFPGSTHVLPLLAIFSLFRFSCSRYSVKYTIQVYLLITQRSIQWQRPVSLKYVPLVKPIFLVPGLLLGAYLPLCGIYSGISDILSH